jgi:MFS family permease
MARSSAGTRSLAGAPWPAYTGAAVKLERRERLLTRVFVFAWASHFFHATATTAYVHLPGFLKALGASELDIGGLSGTTAGLAIVSRPLLAPLMDRAGRRAFILAAGAAHVALCVLYCFITHWGIAVYVLRALHGVVEAVIFSVLFTYAADVVPVSRRTEGLAWFGVSAQIPIALAGLLGDGVLARAGYRELFLGTVVAAALGLMLSLPLENPPASPAAAKSRGVVACLTQPDLLPLWFVGVAFTTSIAPLFIFLKTYVLHTGVGSVGLFLSLYSLSAAALRVFLGWVPDRIGPKRALVPAIVGVAAGLWLIARATTALEVGAAGMLAGAGHGFAFPIIVGLVVDRARAEERGVAMSLVTSIFDVGLLIGGPLFGAIIEASGYQLAFGTAGAVAATGLGAFLAWDRAAP